MVHSNPSTAAYGPLPSGSKSTAEVQPLEIIVKEMQTALGVVSALLAAAEVSTDGNPERADHYRRAARAVAEAFRSRTLRHKDVARMLDLIRPGQRPSSCRHAGISGGGQPATGGGPSEVRLNWADGRFD